jgi:hypothetical protein
MKMAVLWGVAPCILVETDRRFRDIYCLHHYAVSTSETSASFYENARRNVLRGDLSQNRHHKNKKSQTVRGMKIAILWLVLAAKHIGQSVIKIKERNLMNTVIMI